MPNGWDDEYIDYDFSNSLMFDVIPMDLVTKPRHVMVYQRSSMHFCLLGVLQNLIPLSLEVYSRTSVHDLDILLLLLFRFFCTRIVCAISLTYRVLLDHTLFSYDILG